MNTDYTIELQGAHDAFSDMDHEERHIAFLDVRSAIAVARRLDAKYGGNRLELEEQVLEIYLKIVGHDHRNKISTRCLR